MKLTAKRRALLAEAAAGGIEWNRVDAARSRGLSWLYAQGLLAWDPKTGNRRLATTPAGRSALAQEEMECG